MARPGKYREPRFFIQGGGAGERKRRLRPVLGIGFRPRIAFRSGVFADPLEQL